MTPKSQKRYTNSQIASSKSSGSPGSALLSKKLRADEPSQHGPKEKKGRENPPETIEPLSRRSSRNSRPPRRPDMASSAFSEDGLRGYNENERAVSELNEAV